MSRLKKFILLIPLMITSLTGCNLFQKDPLYNSQSVLFVNLSPDYSIRNNYIKICNASSDDTLPYVDVEEAMRKLDGFFDFRNITISMNKLKNYLVIYSSFGYSVKIDYEKNTIETNNFDTFYTFVKSSSVTNYNSYLKVSEYKTSGQDKAVFDLGKYGYDILCSNNKCYIPLFVFNLLFCSQNYYNLFYNGNKVYGYYGEISPSNIQAYSLIYGSSLQGGQTQKSREHTLNSLCFTMDYFYGLKADKEITNFIDYISEEDKNLFLSTNPDDNELALKHIMLRDLDDLHTRLDSKSYFSNTLDKPAYILEDCGDFTQSFYSIRHSLDSDRSSKINLDGLPVRYFDDTAIITLDSFNTGMNDDIFDSNKNVKDDAWLYDSYWLMDFVMKDIEIHEEVKNIILDLSLNGGGNLGAMYRVFGFLTDEDLKDYSYNTLTNELSLYSYKIDVDRDNSYTDKDAYSNYNWSILSSLGTFSAANALICKAKQAQAATIIGQKSGGGMCSVLPLVLADGTAVAISSQNTDRYFEVKDGKNYYSSTENGFLPDIEIPYESFYIDEELIELIHTL